MLIISGYVTVGRHEVDAFIADLRGVVSRTRAEDGCVFYDFAISDPETGTVIVIEQWRDQASLDAHLAIPHIRALLDKWRPKIIANVKMYEATKELPIG